MGLGIRDRALGIRDWDPPVGWLTPLNQRTKELTNQGTNELKELNELLKYYKNEGFCAFLRLIVSEGWVISTMKNADDFANNFTEHDEPSATPVTGYGTLLKTTRPLTVTKGTVTPCISFVYRDQPDSLEAGNSPGELALRRGEIIHTDLPEQQAAKDAGPTAKTDLVISSSNLRIRVYIGMS